jgi:hypothetical protein
MNTIVKYTTAPKDDPFNPGKPWDAAIMAEAVGEMSPLFDSIEEAIDDSRLAGVEKENLSCHKITFEVMDDEGEAK